MFNRISKTRVPNIDVYSVCRDEAEILPFFLDYYDRICNRIFIYDNQSKDGSKELMDLHPKCTRIDYDTGGVLRDDVHMYIKNSVWKDSRGSADWVIVCDLDEFLYHKNLARFLWRCKNLGVTIPKPVGFNMISDEMPTAGRLISDQIKYGAYSRQFSKSIIFDPNRIDEINYGPGAHEIEPDGDVKVLEDDELKLLHYKYLGGLPRLQARWDRVGVEISEINKDSGWGVKRMDRSIIGQRYRYVKKHAELVVDSSPFNLKIRLFGKNQSRDRTSLI